MKLICEDMEIINLSSRPNANIDRLLSGFEEWLRGNSMNDAVVELSNIEIHEHCMLNRITGEREYNNEKKQMPYFTGLYFKGENVFLHYILQRIDQ